MGWRSVFFLNKYYVSWNSFIELQLYLFVFVLNTASIEIRHAYRKFIGAVVELMNGDIVNDEFQEVAMKTYDLFSRINANSDADRVTKAVLQKK